MKLVCSRENLHNGVNIVQKAVSAKSTMPILQGILIEAGDTLKLTGNDLEIGIECVVESDIMEKGSVVVNAKMFGEIIRKLPDSDVSLDYNEESGIVVIKCGKSLFKIHAMSSEGFPALPEVKKENSFSVESSLLRDLIRQTIFAVGTDEFRAILTGCLIESKNNELNFVALDGFRIALRKHNLEGDIPDFSLVVPGKTLNEILKILQYTDCDIAIYNSKNQILFDAGNFKLVSRLLEGEFFNYRNAIPEDFETKITVDTKELLSSIERAYLISIEEQGRNYPVDFKLYNDTLMITSDTTKGSVKEELEVEMEGSDLEVSFNPLYFIEALRVIDDEKINIYFRSIGACTIKPTEGNSFVYMILPLLK
ncbi:MAG TPA: DNA polymerase III subunit beta [Clostridiaceae bacterium]|nr:DNA polymerase III subunit beta [Clostridiaceae bacterium]